jgi:hypothetical protein
MSEQPVGGPAAPKTPGKKYAGLTRNQWFIVGGVFVAALAYIVWKRKQAASAAASTGASNVGSNECTDANGNPVDCNEAFAQELAALQNQLDQAQGQAGGGSAGSGGGGTVGNGGTYTGDGTGATATTQPAATPVTSTGTTSTGTATKAAPKTAGAITGLAASNVTKTSFTAKWNPASNASQGYSWVVRDLASHTQTSAGKTNSTSVTVSGLKSGVDYNFGIQALPGGAGNNMHVRTK